MTRCEKCKGKKVIIGLGYMMKKCPDCDGSGLVELDEHDTKPDRKRAGRKRKIDTEE